MRGYVFFEGQGVSADTFASWVGKPSSAGAGQLFATVRRTGMVHTDLLPHNAVMVDGVISMIDLESVVPVWALPLQVKVWHPPYCLEAAALAFDAAGGAKWATAQLNNAQVDGYRRHCCYRSRVRIGDGTSTLAVDAQGNLTARAGAALHAYCARLFEV